MNTLNDMKLRQLDAALQSAKASLSRPVPGGGWIRTIRQATGMSMRQLANRAGVSKSAVANVERTEAKGSVKLETLSRIADALGCELAYSIVPRQSLEEFVRLQALETARAIVGRVSDSMSLEDQETSPEEREHLIQELADELRRDPERLWND